MFPTTVGALALESRLSEMKTAGFSVVYDRPKDDALAVAVSNFR